MKNHYAPPDAPLADSTAEFDAVLSTAPQSVKTATLLLWTTVAIGVCNSAYLVAPRLRNAAVLAVLVVLMGILFGLYLWLIRSIRRGRNWARILFLILVSGGFLVTALSPGRYFPKNIGAAAIWLVQGLLQISAVCLLFSRTARPWFRRR